MLSQKGTECRGGARRSRGSQEHPEGEEILVRGSPAASELERPLLGLWPSGLFSAPRACVPGSGRLKTLLNTPGTEGQRWFDPTHEAHGTDQFIETEKGLQVTSGWGRRELLFISKIRGQSQIPQQLWSQLCS